MCKRIWTTYTFFKQNTSNKTYGSREQTCNVQKGYRKIDKKQQQQKKKQKNKKTKKTKQKKKLGLPTNKTLQEKIQPKIINLSKCHLTKFQVLLLTKGPKFCPTTKRNVFDIKSDTKELARKLKVREI